MIFFFKSSRKTDKCSQITIMTTNQKRAENIAILKFKEYGYKGTPILAI